MRLSAKQKALILSFVGKAEAPVYTFGGLPAAVARLRRMGIVSEQSLTPYGAVVARAIENGQRWIPTKDQAINAAVARAVRRIRSSANG